MWRWVWLVRYIQYSASEACFNNDYHRISLIYIGMDHKKSYDTFVMKLVTKERHIW